MSQRFEQDRWRGHAVLAWQLGRGWTHAGRGLAQLAQVFALFMAVLALIVSPTGGSLLALSALLAGPVLVVSSRATAQAMAVMGALWLAPQAARQQWLRGWWRMQALGGPALALLGASVVALRSGLGGGAMAVAALVLMAQALGAWSASQAQQRLPRLAFAATLLWLMALLLLDMLGLGAVIAPWLPRLSLALAAGSAVQLWRWHARLRALAAGQGQRPSVATPAAPTRWAWVRWLKGFAPLETGGARRGVFQMVSGVLFPAWMMGLNPGWRVGSQWQGVQGPGKLFLLAWLVAMISSTLVHRPIHWRHWLRPGGVQRQRLGGHILAATLRLQTLAAVVVVLVIGIVAGSLGTPWSAVAQMVWRHWPLLLEWAVATALSVVWVGLYQLRRRTAVLGAVAILLLYGVGVGFGELLRWGTVNEAYVATLLAVLAGLWWLANAVWARVDLHRLMVAGTVKTRSGWET